MLAILASFSQRKFGKFFLLTTIVLSFALTSYHNFTFHPHYQVWMCNFTALFSIILLLKFNQILLDITMFFAWTGDIFTFLVPNNQTLPNVDEFPIIWLAYWLKHIIPLCITLYLIFSEKRRLSHDAYWIAVRALIIYICFIANYNLIFDQNIMDLRFPTVEIQRYFGPWPIYIIVDTIIILTWYLAIDYLQKKWVVRLDLNILKKEG
jgi:uncharacterized membrane protein YwaF